MLNLPALDRAPECVTGPFSDEEIAALFAPLEGARGVLLAVSGGPDSVALMLLAATWANAGRRKAKLAVATIDHGLRAGSRSEAETVAGWAARLGLRHQILAWEGEKPGTRIQELAREARYRLLSDHAHAIGADYLVTAHHADDQAETILFRLLRGSGIAGLAGMRRMMERDALIHFRPLLSYPKQALVDCCQAQGHAYFSDPSNENPAFARTRLRHLLPLLSEHGLDRAALLRLGLRAGRADDALAERARMLREALEAERSAESFSAAFSHLRDEPEEILLRIVESEIETINGGRSVRLERLETLVEALGRALREGFGWCGTLGGTVLTLDRDGILTIVPENRRHNGEGTSGASQDKQAGDRGKG
ncbi:MAG TPA: tRNA lysidine(34) synthetase TilS [Methylovirgula sp.]|nr:tRNA lysidine(34) synthetase TilS [Methylovirgula sp.]